MCIRDRFSGQLHAQHVVFKIVDDYVAAVPGEIGPYFLVEDRFDLL